MVKQSDDKNVISVKNSLLKSFSSKIDKIPLVFLKKTKNKFSTALLNDFATNQINLINADIVHLHWINNGMISIKSITKIKAPIFWTFLDMWPYTGGYHYDFEEEQFHKLFLSKYIFNLKRKVFSKIDFSVISISEWIRNGVINSSIMKNKEISIVYPGLDLTIFKPNNKEFCRKLLNLPLDKKLIMFGAINSTTDLRKGFFELIQSLKKITDKEILDNTELVVFGASNGDFIKDLNLI